MSQNDTANRAIRKPMENTNVPQDGSKSYPLPRVMMIDEIDSFECGFTREQALAEIAAETEQWRELIDSLKGEPWEGQADG